MNRKIFLLFVYFPIYLYGSCFNGFLQIQKWTQILRNPVNKEKFVSVGSRYFNVSQKSFYKLAADHAKIDKGLFIENEELDWSNTAISAGTLFEVTAILTYKNKLERINNKRISIKRTSAAVDFDVHWEDEGLIDYYDIKTLPELTHKDFNIVLKQFKESVNRKIGAMPFHCVFDDQHFSSDCKVKILYDITFTKPKNRQKVLDEMRKVLGPRNFQQYFQLTCLDHDFVQEIFNELE